MTRGKFIQVGCGKMGKYTIQYAMDKGYELVGAYDVNEKIIGKKISEVYKDEISSTVLKFLFKKE